MHHKTGIVLVGIGESGNLSIDPSRHYVIKAGDVIMWIGKPDEIERLEEECRGKKS